MQAFYSLSRRRCVASQALAGLSLAGMLAVGRPAAAQQSFPYVAYVASESAEVRSGPDAASYVTARLPAGFAVEVYRHDADGACAIRPPQGSFSLAPAAAVRPLDGRTAEIVGAAVPARVGSGVSTDAAAIQVLLQQGERVELLGPAAGLADWVRISPPAGEFRWISARHLTRTPPAEGAGSRFVGDIAGWRPQGASGPAGAASVTPASATSEAVAPPAAIRPGALVDAALYVVAGSPAAQQWDPYRQLQYQQPLAPPVMSGPGPQPNEGATSGPSTSAVPLAEGAAAVSPGYGATPAPPGAAPQPRVRFAGQPDAAAGDPRLGELELALSRIVVGPPLEWRFETLRQETAALLAQAQQPELREKLRDLLERIAMFEQVQRRYQVGAGTPVAYAPLPPVTTVPAITPTPSGAAVGAPAGTPPPSDGTAAAAATPDPFVESDPPRAAGADPQGGLTSDSAAVLGRVQSDLGGGAAPAGTPATTARFDAVGTLKPVYSRRRGAPRYALVDDRGAVVSFLSPSSDVNLDGFLGQRIGVNGSRGFIPEFRQSHVTAGRVTPLDGTVRR